MRSLRNIAVLSVLLFVIIVGLSIFLVVALGTSTNP